MQVFTSHLCHGRMRVIIILAGLFDLRFEVFLIFLRGLQTGSRSISFTLCRSGSSICLIDCSLSCRNFRICQFIQLDDPVGQIRLHTGKL